jgi:DNA ligase-1
MGDLADGEQTQVKGSGSAIYTLKNSGGVYPCTCPAWMHQSLGIERRTCKHLRALRGESDSIWSLPVGRARSHPKKDRLHGMAQVDLIDDKRWTAALDRDGNPVAATAVIVVRFVR